VILASYARVSSIRASRPCPQPTASYHSKLITSLKRIPSPSFKIPLWNMFYQPITRAIWGTATGWELLDFFVG
jgi:hypothetical protein